MNRPPVTLLALLLLAAASSFAQTESPWREVLPWPTTSVLDGVAYGDGRFVAVGEVALTSDDGVVWTPHDLPEWVKLNGVVWSGGQFVAVGTDSQLGVVATSLDGGTWSARPIAACPLYDVAGDGQAVVVAGGGLRTGALLAFSSDVESWVGPTLSGAEYVNVVAWGNGRWIAAAGSTALSSSDGIEWAAVDLPEPVRDLAWDGSRFVAVTCCTVLASSDGLSWEQIGTPPLESPSFVAASDGQLLIGGARPRDGDPLLPVPGFVAQSRDGALWSDLVHAPSLPLAAVRAEGEWVVVGYQGLVGTSPDGLSWRWAWQGTPAPVTQPPTHGNQLVPVAAHRAGLGGSDWRSDLHVTAASNEWTEIWLGLVAGDGGAPDWQRVALPPGGQLDRDDLVGRGFGLDDAAGPMLVASECPLAVTSRTFTGGAGGTYGQEIPAIPMAELAEGGTARVLPMLRQDGAFRTNLGVTNGGDEPLAVEIALFDAEGRALGTVDRELPPLGWEQVDGVLAEVGAAPLSDAYAVVSASPSTARFAAYASIVDTVTGDPTTITGLSAAAEPLVVPAAGRGPGLAGTFWRSDLEVVNPGREPAAYRIERLDGSAAVAFELAAGQAHRHTDVLAELGVNGTAALRVVPTAGEVAVASRTYTTGGGGGFGQRVPAVAESAIAGGRTVLPGLAESPRFRTNIGLVNPGDEDVAAVVELIRGDGSAVGAVRAPVPAGSLVTLVRAFGEGWVESGYAVVHGEPEGVPLLAWASVIDSATGDPVLVMGR